MLSLESKKAEKVDWVKPLSAYLKNTYSANIVDDHKDSLNYVQQLRDDIARPQDKTEAAKDTHLRYYATLQSIDLRFPISEKDVRVSFSWTDSLKGKKTSLYTIHYERASVLYNIGAIYSFLGSLQNRASVDGLKTACQYFQAAAGVLQYCKEEIMEKHIDIVRQNSSVVDLSPEFLAVTVNIMLAQAQECFYEKAVKDNMKSGIIAKLAAQVADYYDVAATLLSANGQLSGAVPKQWLPHLQLKSSVYKALSYFRTGAAHGEADEYGIQVARYIQANKTLDEAKKKHLKNVSNEFQTSANASHTLITNALTKAEKENDTIYHDTVPNESKLGGIEKKSIVKCLPFTDIFQSAQFSDPFVKIVPFVITQKLSIYQDRKDTLVRNEFRAIDEQNQIAIASLSSMNLPGSIEALETPADQLPPALLEKMNQVRADGGARNIIELVETLNKLGEEDCRLLEEASKKLDNEEREDNDMRSQYTNRWSRSPSHSLTIQLRQEAAKFKANVDHARKSDAYVMKKFQDHQQFIVKLSGGIEEIKSILPSNTAQSGESVKIVNELKQTLGQLDRLIAERGTIRNDLTNISKNDDVTTRLLAANGKSDEEIFQEEIQKYAELQARLQSSYNEQSSLLGRIHQQNTEFVSRRQSNNSTAQREQVLQQLSTAHKIYMELKNNLREGIQFYLNFQEILKQYKVKCEDFILARQTEKEDLLRDIRQGEQQQYHQVPVNSYPPQMPNLANMKPVYQQPPPGYPMGGQPSYGSAPPGYGMPAPQQYPTGYGAQYQQAPPPHYQQQQQQQRPPYQPYPGQYQYPPKQ